MTESKKPQDYLIVHIASKVSYHKANRSIFLIAIFGIAVFLVTACAGNVSPAAAPLPAPSETPPPAATLSPTATLDTFEDLKVCVDWKKPCPATEEDLMSGRLIDFAKRVGQPFPNEAYNTGNFFAFGWVDSSYLSFTFYNMNDRPPHPEQKLYRKKGSLIVPYRWLMHFSVPYQNGDTNLISIQQWLNPDGSIRYLQYLVSRLNKEEAFIAPIVLDKMGMMMPQFKKLNPSDPNIDNLYVVSYRDKERETLMEEWLKTGIIPEKLQYKVLTPLIRLTTYEKKLP
jgi:hypothetical protein